MHYLTACCIAKKEHPYIREWLDYHALLGVEAFHVYDDGDPGDEPLAQTLRELVARGTVQVHRSIGERRQQMLSYDDCLARHGAASRWIAFFDVDEFLVPRRGGDLRELLVPREAEAGFAVSWLTFGSSGHRTQPPGLVTDAYIRRSEATFAHNRHVKSIVQPARTLSARNPHAFDYRPGGRCVDELGRLVPDAFAENTTETVAINHYFTKSRAEFLAKAARGRADGGRFLKRQFGRFENAEQMFEDFDRHCSVVEDRLIQRLTAPLRAAAAGDALR